MRNYGLRLMCLGLALLMASTLFGANRAEKLRQLLDSGDRSYVFAVAHRAAWRGAPENSVPAIEAAIAMGADMVEIDVSKTKDGFFVLSHDGKLDRSTDRKGKVSELTLAEVRQAKLRNRLGGPNESVTEEHVPTLEEALEACRGRILVNIDKFNLDPAGIAEVIHRVGVERQVVLKGYGNFDTMSKRMGKTWELVSNRSFSYMPILNAGTDDNQRSRLLADFRGWDSSPYPPPAYEVCIPDSIPAEFVSAFRASNNSPRLWINTLWDSLAHGHSETTKGATPDSTWGWCLGEGATLIQTDDPKGLVDYLVAQGRHNLEERLLPVVPQPTKWSPVDGKRCDLDSAKVETAIVNDAELGEEGYRVKIAADSVSVEASTELGLIWAKRTLEQLRSAGRFADCGTIFDKPKYKVRGFTLDVARMFHPMDFLYDVARTMSRFKMNVLHVHLNDCEIVKNPKGVDWSTKYAAFRMESTTYPELTAKDGFYTKAEFRKFMKDAKAMGVTVIPEFDVPAHSLAFMRVRPDFGSAQYGLDHFDLAKTDEIISWLKPLFAEYLSGDDPVFAGPYMHVGTDEYNPAAAEQFRDFSDKMLKLVRSFGYRACAWGALSHAKGSTPVIADRDITMDIWYNPFYRPEEALKAGYSIVSIPDGLVYIVPQAGYYYDYLNCRHLYENWDPRQIGDYTVPEDKADQLLGGKFALWNDLCGKGQSLEENWKRIVPPVKTLGQKFWSGKRADESWSAFSSIADGIPLSVDCTRPNRPVNGK